VSWKPDNQPFRTIKRPFRRSTPRSTRLCARRRCAPPVAGCTPRGHPVGRPGFRLRESARCGRALTEKLEADFRADLEHCVAFSAAEYKARRVTSRLVDSTLRLCSPLL
jgi:hypothetical protein